MTRKATERLTGTSIPSTTRWMPILSWLATACSERAPFGSAVGSKTLLISKRAVEVSEVIDSLDNCVVSGIFPGLLPLSAIYRLLCLGLR